jgi:hypothetical protein
MRDDLPLRLRGLLCCRIAFKPLWMTQICRTCAKSQSKLRQIFPFRPFRNRSITENDIEMCSFVLTAVNDLASLPRIESVLGV